MAKSTLTGLKVAILATDGFEQSELSEPRRALLEAGAEVDIVSLRPGRIRGWKGAQWADEIDVDVTLQEADPRDYDALVLPGGVMNPDTLRTRPEAVAFVRAFFDAAKPVAAICHGPWTIIDAGAARGRRLTSWPSLRTDLTNAGANWVDEQVVVDGQLITSRKPSDLPAFNRKLLELLGSRAAARSTAASRRPEAGAPH